MKIGGQFANYWYKDPDTIDKTEYGGFTTIDYEISPNIFINTGYTFTHSDARQNPDFNNYDFHNMFIGPRYEYADKSFIYGQGGYTIIDYASGDQFSNPFWSVGIAHNFGTYTATVESMVSYDQDPQQNLTEVTSYTGNLEKTFLRGTAGVSLGYLKYKYLNNSLEPTTDSYRAGINITYELLPRLTGTLAFVAEQFHEKGIGNYNRYFVNPNLAYVLPYDITASLNYISVDYSSNNMAENNREINRVRKITFRLTPSPEISGGTSGIVFSCGWKTTSFAFSICWIHMESGPHFSFSVGWRKDALRWSGRYRREVTKLPPMAMAMNSSIKSAPPDSGKTYGSPRKFWKT
jgi:hypothetical protein